MIKPSVLMLDEPTAGVSPIVMDELFDHIIKVKLLHLKNPYQPPKKELLTLGSFSNSFPVPEYLFSPVTKT